MPRIPRIRRKRFILLGLVFISSLMVLKSLASAFMGNLNEQIILDMIKLSANETILPDENTVIYGPSKSRGCENSGSSHHLLLMIITSPENMEQRKAIRSILKQRVPSWEQRIRVKHPQYQIGYGIRAIFFVGRTPDGSETTVLDLIQEGRNNGDMIIDNFYESYFNLAIKTLRMLKWVERYCPNVPYLIKIDDDVYMDGDKILDFLHNSSNLVLDNQPNHHHPDLIAGYKYSKLERISDPGSKWYTPASVWSWGHFPDFVSGICYILGSRARSQLYAGALKRNLFHLEDLFLTGIVRDELAAEVHSRNKLNKSHNNDKKVQEGGLNEVQDIPGIRKWWIIWQKLSHNCAALQNLAIIHPLSPKELLCYHHLEGGANCDKDSWLPILYWC